MRREPATRDSLCSPPPARPLGRGVCSAWRPAPSRCRVPQGLPAARALPGRSGCQTGIGMALLSSFMPLELSLSVSPSRRNRRQSTNFRRIRRRSAIPQFRHRPASPAPLQVPNRPGPEPGSRSSESGLGSGANVQPHWQPVGWHRPGVKS
jgi:hypothetical protein